MSQYTTDAKENICARNLSEKEITLYWLTYAAEKASLNTFRENRTCSWLASMHDLRTKKHTSLVLISINRICIQFSVTSTAGTPGSRPTCLTAVSEKLPRRQGAWTLFSCFVHDFELFPVLCFIGDGFRVHYEEDFSSASLANRHVISSHLSRSSVSIQTELRAGRPRFNSRQVQRWDYLSTPTRPDRLWCPLIHLPNGYGGSYSGGKAAGAWN